MNTKRRKTGARLAAILLSLCLIVGLLPMTALADGTEWDGPTKAFVKAVFSNAVETTGADSQICAATVKDESGDFELHYVYSPDSIWNVQLFDKVRDGLAEPYKSLIPELEEDDHNKKGFLFLSDDQYEDMELNWADPAAVAEALVPGSGTVTTQENTSSVSSGTSTDIIEDYCSDYDEKAVEFINEVGESITRPAGANTIEAIYSAVKGEPYYIIEDGIMKECNDVVIYGYVSQISAYTATKEEEGTAPTKKRDTYNVYAENVINGGSDSQVYANTITIKRDGYDGDEILVLHYVYSPNAIHSNELMEQIRAGLSEPYKSLVPTFEEGDSNRGFLRVSQDQEKYESMDLEWGNVAATAAALTPNRVSSLSTHNNSDTAISVTDISAIHADEKVVSENQLIMEDFYEHLSELGQLGIGKNRVEVITSVSIRTETVEDKAYYDVFNTMHVTQIYAQGAVSVDKITPASDPITLPVRVLEEGDAEYSPAPELSATFTPDTAVTVGEFNQWQGLAIDYYNPMAETEWYEPVSEGYDIQAEYTVSIPLTGYAGETLSGTLTIPLPEGYDGATARIKNGAAASSYTATTVSFPVTLDVSYGSADLFGLLIEYKEAQEPVQPPVIIAGANGSWQKSGTDGLSFTSNAAFADFIKVQVDGKDLDASNYTVKEGSTIVTLNAAYLNTLSVGKHTLSIVSENGTATTEFTITAAQTGGDSQTGGTTPQEPGKNEGAVTSPQTGDNSNMLLWVALLFLSGGALSAVTYKKKKQTN